jgi:signal transduction histidine kinase/ActR/RegA family two-component response regulator
MAGAIAVTAVGLASLAGWVLDNDHLKALLYPGVTIKTNAAIALACCGLSLLVQLREPVSGSRRFAGLLLAAVAVALGVLTLSEHIAGWNLGIDEWLFREAPGAIGTASPNRMGPPASLSFTLLGLALLLLDRPIGRSRFPSQHVALPAALLGLLPLHGYAYGARELFVGSRLTGIAAHTALAIVALSLCVLGARPERSVAALLCREDAAGALARRLLVPAVLLPFVVGLFVAAGSTRGSYDSEFAVSLMAIALMAALSILIWRAGTDLARTVEERDGAMEAAEEANRAKDQFLAVLSHELRTPLSPVLTGIALLESGARLDDRGKHVLDVLRRNVELEARLIDDLLDVTRIARGKLELDKCQSDLVTIIDRAVEVCRPDIEAGRLRFSVDYGARSYLVEADAAHLQQVFWNLLNNAVKFTPAGGRLTIRCRPADGHVLVEVSDDGVGIDPSALATIFDAFAQAGRPMTRRFGGLGLGLAISKALVELHGGQIEARSEGEDRGSTFVVRLPTLPAGTGGNRAAGSETPATVPAAGKRLRVLVVEDHRDTAEMMTRLLELEGHEVRTAANVAAALQAVDREGPFDLLVSDLGLPDRSGLDLMRDLRTRGNGLAGIALSGYGQEIDIEQSRAAGFAAHLVKPADPRVLLDHIERIARQGVTS